MKNLEKFFQPGGTLDPNSPSYVERPADDELFEQILASDLCYVLTTRQMGKSSLMLRIAQRLEKRQVHTAIIDLTLIGVETEGKWYFGFLNLIRKEFNVALNLVEWWEDQPAESGYTQRFLDFLYHILSTEIEGNVVIFIDEIDRMLILDFRDTFFASIRAIHNKRAHDQVFRRLTFVLIGFARPADLISDPSQTPFNIGVGINLQEFSQKEARVLKQGLQFLDSEQRENVFARVLYWTNGHPYLTQMVCSDIVRAGQTVKSFAEVDALVNKRFFSDETPSDSNLDFVQAQFDHLKIPQHRSRLLKQYKKVYENLKIPENEQSLEQNRLKLIGLIRSEKGFLAVRNRIYSHVFDEDWITANMPPFDWHQYIQFATIIMVVIVLAFLTVFFMIFRQPENIEKVTFDFNDNTQSVQWTTLNGFWTIIDGSYVQQTELGAIDMITLFNRPVTGDYSFQTDIQIIGDHAGAGIIFNTPTIYSKKGGELVRYRGEREGNVGLYLVHFDEISNEFVEKGFAPEKSFLDGEWHHLKVDVVDQTYSVSLDGKVIHNKIPFDQNPSGFVGLAVFNAQARFDNVILEGALLSATPPPPPSSILKTSDFTNPTEELSYWFPASDEGIWKIEAGSYVQEQFDEHDHVSFFNWPIPKENDYRVQIDMRIFENDLGGGAGIIFNAATIESKKQAHMLRSQIDVGGGTGLFWGQFDDNSVFNGQGFFPEPKLNNNNEWYQLEIQVTNDRYSIRLNDNLLISGILFDRVTDSYVGLVSNKAKVEFRNFNLEIFDEK